MNYRKKKALWGYIFILPNMLGFLLFTCVPILYALHISFQKWDIITPMKFIGWKNYLDLVKDQRMWDSLMHTLKYAVVATPLTVILSLVLANLLNQKYRFSTFYRAIIFLPVITSMVSVSLIWSMILADELGLVNSFLIRMGIGNIPFLSSTKNAIYTLAAIGVWKNLGYNMTIYLAGLQSISPSLYEAATIDGANSIQKFFRITVPLLTPTSYFICIMSVINSLQIFDQVYIMTKGGPANSTETIVHYLYTNGFQYLKMGYASAISFVLFLLIFILSLLQNKFFNRFGNFDG